MQSQSLPAWIEEHQDELIDGLKQFLRFASVANVDLDQTGADPCRNCADWLVEQLGSMGFASRLIEAQGKPHVFAEKQVDPDAATVLIYGHYDVQPPDPLDLWQSDPFEPVIRDGAIYARGANDNKGQFWAHLCALQAMLALQDQLPVNIKIFVEGEEEIGSPGLEEVLVAHRELLSADYCLVSDSEFYDEKTPAITYRLRGIAAWQIDLIGPADDLHSGIHGGAVRNPVNALARLVAAMHDDSGRIMLPGFYDDVVELTDAEIQQWRELPFDEAGYASELGLIPDQLTGGEEGLTVLQRRWGRPTLDANGIVGGYIQDGIKTVIASKATAKVSIRLVPDQIPEKLDESIRRFVSEHTPRGCRAEVTAFGAGRPVGFSPDSPGMRAGRDALQEAFGLMPAMIGCGASVPITELFQRVLAMDVVMLGYGLPSDRIHSPNERFQLRQLFGGARATASFLNSIGSQFRHII